MQYRLSTIFLIVFFTAATLATQDGFIIGLWPILLLLAFWVNRAKAKLPFNIYICLAIILFSHWIYQPPISRAREYYRNQECINHLIEIGRALHRYHAAHDCFPMPAIKDQDGRSLHSWRVEILPELGYEKIYAELDKNEPWDSPGNSKILNQYQVVSEYLCPSDINPSSSYVSVIGPGTAWSEEKPIVLSDLPNEGKQTVMVVEMSSADAHWAKPDSVTPDQLLKQMVPSLGAMNMSGHPSHFHILLADGSVWSISKDIPIFLLEKLFRGEVKNIEELNRGADNAPLHCAEVVYHGSFRVRAINFLREKVPHLSAVIVWLISAVLLFRRAIKSRREKMECVQERESR